MISTKSSPPAYSLGKRYSGNYSSITS